MMTNNTPVPAPAPRSSSMGSSVSNRNTKTVAVTKKRKLLLLPPYPISIELRNVVPNYHAPILGTTTTTTTTTGRRHRQQQQQQQQQQRSSFDRPEYSTKLLHQIQLQVTVTVTVDDDDDNDNNNTPNAPTETAVETSQQKRDNSTTAGTSLDADETFGIVSLERKQRQVVLYDSTSAQNTDDDAYQSTAISSSSSKSSSFIPIWYHVHDSISEDQLLQLRTTPSIYESIQARFAVQQQPTRRRRTDSTTMNSGTTTTTTAPTIDSKQTTSHTSNGNNTLITSVDEDDDESKNLHYFLEMNIHPSRLCRIPPSMLNSNSTTGSSNMYDRLPINCVIVRFSDNTFRIHPSQYQLLDSYYQFHTITNGNSINIDNTGTNTMIDHILPTTTTTTTTPISPIQNHNANNNMIHGVNTSLSMNGSFFEDNVFHALDTTETATDPLPRVHGPSINDDDDNENQNSNGHDYGVTASRISLGNDDDVLPPVMNGDHHSFSSPPPLPPYNSHDNIDSRNDHDSPEMAVPGSDSSKITTMTNNTIAKLSFLSLLDSKGNFEIAVADGDTYKQSSPILETVTGNDDANSNTNRNNNNGKDYRGVDSTGVSVIRRSGNTAITEMEQLQRLIDKESASLVKETVQLQQNVTHVRCMRDQIRRIETQNMQICDELYKEQMKHYKDQFIVEAQRIRLIRELIQIYPITTAVLRNDRYFIRGLEIPSDLYSGNVSEEIISAAFGFLCHVTYLLSKYLGVHVRYRLHCQSSRSAIQGENGATYPLFPGRQVEREQFEYGVHLLHRTIDCICTGRGIQQQQQLPTVSSKNNNIHILAKILRIYDNVKDGY